MTRYDAHPDHPLHGVDPEILETARGVVRGAAHVGDVPHDLVEPLADSVVSSLRQAGYLREYRAPLSSVLGIATLAFAFTALVVWLFVQANR